MKKRFTLTEVLVVVFLIGVLTAIGFGMYSYAMNSAKESATRALFSRLNAALESCNTDSYQPPFQQREQSHLCQAFYRHIYCAGEQRRRERDRLYHRFRRRSSDCPR